MFKSHLALGFLIGLTVVYFFEIQYPALFVLLVTFLSGIPDIDTENSKYGRKIYPVSLIIRMLFGHRGFMHSLFPPVILYFVFSYFDLQYIGLAVLVGYVAHLIGDALTWEGIAFFYPFSKFRITGFMRTGGFVEGLVFVVILLGNIGFLSYMLLAP